MPRVTIDLEEHIGIITSWHEMALTDSEIMDRLQAQFGLEISRTTFRKILKDWNPGKYSVTTDSPELRTRISYLFIAQGFSDSEIFHVLKSEGFEVGARALARIRREQNLYRRLTPYERLQQEEELRTIIQTELDKGEIEGYGRRLLYTYFRTSGVLAPRLVWNSAVWPEFLTLFQRQHFRHS